MTDDSTVLDPEALERLLDMVGGDIEFLDELIETYLDDAPTQLRAMRAATEAGDMGELVRPAHSLKTNSANMGAEALAGLCRSLETEARGGAVRGALERVAQAEAAFATVRVALLALRADR